VIRSLLMMVLFSSPAAQASDVVVGVTGGWDNPTDHFWSGLQLAVHPDQTEGWGWSARVEPGYAPFDGAPVFFGELGVHVVVPSDPEDPVTVRTGLTARTGVPFVTYPLPIRFGEVGVRRPGIVPSLLWNVEFAWDMKVDFVVGARAGATSSLATFQCSAIEPDDDCIIWLPSFSANFYARMDLESHLAIELSLGHQTQLSLGYRF
jgi:hypothetical protein